jgi:hypothetical protein
MAAIKNVRPPGPEKLIGHRRDHTQMRTLSDFSATADPRPSIPGDHRLTRSPLKEPTMNPPDTIRPRDISEELEPTSQAALAAHDAHLRQATESVRWERRGWLGRLVRVERTRE